jgi:HSP20 family protein
VNLNEWNPLREMDTFSREMGNWLVGSPFKQWPNPTNPKIDLWQTDTDLVVTAEIPGVPKKDLEVYLEENFFRISGQIKRNEDFKDENVLRTERYYGSFSRTLPLPVFVKSAEARADYKDGILTITVPKLEPTKPIGKKIDIQ